jgi:hypothetical protein
MMAGRCFEDWSVGDRIEHETRRTVTKTDNLLITTLTPSRCIWMRWLRPRASSAASW